MQWMKHSRRRTPLLPHHEVKCTFNIHIARANHISHLRLNLLQKLLQLLLARVLLGPLDAQSLRLIRLGNHVNMHMIDQLMCHPTIVLQNIELLGARGQCNLLGDREKLGQGVVRDVGQLCAVVLGNDELIVVSGWTSQEVRNASYCVSRAERIDVKESECLLAFEDLHRRDFPCSRGLACILRRKRRYALLTLDDFAKDTGGHSRHSFS